MGKLNVGKVLCGDGRLRWSGGPVCIRPPGFDFDRSILNEAEGAQVLAAALLASRLVDSRNTDTSRLSPMFHCSARACAPKMPLGGRLPVACPGVVCRINRPR